MGEREPGGKVPGSGRELTNPMEERKRTTLKKGQVKQRVAKNTATEPLGREICPHGGGFKEKLDTD